MYSGVFTAHELLLGKRDAAGIEQTESLSKHVPDYLYASTSYLLEEYPPGKLQVGLE